MTPKSARLHPSHRIVVDAVALDTVIRATTVKLAQQSIARWSSSTGDVMDR